MTNACPKCHGHGEITRWCPTTKTSGTVLLRYTPKELVPCSCQSTTTAGEASPRLTTTRQTKEPVRDSNHE